MSINAFFGIPEIVDDIKLYPVRAVDWDEFKKCGVHFLSVGEKYVENRVKLDITVYQYLTLTILQGVKNNNFVHLENFVKMLELITREKVEPIYDLKSFICIFKIGETVKGKDKIISHKNYDEIRKIVNEQNIIYEPLTAKDDLANEHIQKNLAKKNKNGVELDMTAMFAVVSTLGGGGIDVNTLSYYGLRARYEIITRREINNLYAMAISQGGEAELKELASKLNIDENPYSIDKVFTVHGGGGDRTI